MPGKSQSQKNEEMGNYTTKQSLFRGRSQKCDGRYTLTKRLKPIKIAKLAVVHADDLFLQNDPSREKIPIIEAVFAGAQIRPIAVECAELLGNSFFFLYIPFLLRSRAWQFIFSRNPRV